MTKESSTVMSGGGVKKVSSGGLGSGVIIDPDGTIMTAAHVVNSADEMMVQLVDGRQFEAKVINSVTLADVAMIKLIDGPSDLSFVKPGNSDNVSMGDPVFVIGTPYGLEHTFTAGYLSSRRVAKGDDIIIDLEFLQTDAAVNQGNSGGPLFTASGELIGIVSHIQSQSGGSEGLGFAASINMAQQVLIRENPLWLGVNYIPIRDELAQALNVPYHEGLLVQKIVKGSIGDKLGLRAGAIPVKLEGVELLIGGDAIVEIGGDTVYFTRAGRERLVHYIRNLNSGDLLEVTVIREGKKVVLTTKKP